MNVVEDKKKGFNDYPHALVGDEHLGDLKCKCDSDIRTNDVGLYQCRNSRVILFYFADGRPLR